MNEVFSSEPVLKELKDFQRRTVDYVFERLYGKDSTCRFLVADEAGLGKTMVARGLIARILEHFQGRERRTDAINIVYVCSNAAIAAQNTKRLNITPHDVIPTRLTLLPRDLSSFQDHGVNFVSLTSGTAFEFTHRRDGSAEERLIIYGILYELFAGCDNAPLLRRGLCRLLRATVGEKVWKIRARHMRKRVQQGGLNPTLVQRFQEDVRADREGVYADLRELCRIFGSSDEKKDILHAYRNRRYTLIGRLRSGLASVCLSALKPDLIILDEFQRFRQLLTGDDESSELARLFFQQEGVRILLLSATPYKMFTLDGEKNDDHYPDFLNTLRFLYHDDESRLEEVKKLLSAMRRELVSPGSGEKTGRETKRSLEKDLLSVMCRTERGRSSGDSNAMLTRTPIAVQLRPEDLRAARDVYRLADWVEAGDQMEYWKSVPWMCFFMRDYELGQKLDGVLAGTAPERGPVLQILERQYREFFHDREHRGTPEAGNPRMRELFAETLDRDMWKLLWMPPSMPYMRPGGVYAGRRDLTKLLVFSAWSAVPNAVSALCSWEAEHRMTGGHFRRGELYEKSRGMLDFTRDSRKRPTGMMVLALMLPCPTLALKADPLRLALEKGAPLKIETMRNKVRAICRKLLKDFPRNRGRGKDSRWYWAAPLLLERKLQTGLPDWSRNLTCWQKAGFGVNADDQEEKSIFSAHVDELDGISVESLGAMPDDLADVFCDMALASPGICALRALHRTAPDLALDSPDLLGAAARIALGFRRLFNIPENVELLRKLADGEGGGTRPAYWRTVLKYGIEGNMQAMLDEYVHMLSRGAHNLGPENKEIRLLSNIREISNDICEALSMRAVSVTLHRPGKEKRAEAPFSVRCRFALRFGDGRDDGDRVVREEMVRKAFNSPFRPFILASTSIGQEGLDFHTWCHAVMHWNLPANPVDLEQREGRVHRYKGHAVRKNLAERYGLRALAGNSAAGRFNGEDPWARLFELAARNRKKGGSELVPYWIFDGSARVEGRVPLLPFSRDVEKFERLRRDLALYRAAFGQPRQEDLLFSLNRQVGENTDGLSRCLISLEPPEVRKDTATSVQQK